MSRPRAAFEAASEYGMSPEDFATTAMYEAGVKDGSIVSLPEHYTHDAPTGTYEAVPGTRNESDPPEPEPEPTPVRSKRK